MKAGALMVIVQDLAEDAKAGRVEREGALKVEDPVDLGLEVKVLRPFEECVIAEKVKAARVLAKAVSAAVLKHKAVFEGVVPTAAVQRVV